MSFRVLLDLSDLKIESFNFVWINVAPLELKWIRDFKLAILRKFNIEKNAINLFVREGFLLDDETINILREDDIVRVQYQEELQAAERRHTTYNGENYLVPLAKRVKRNSIEIEELQTGDKTKRKKKRKMSLELSSVENMSILVDGEVNVMNSTPVTTPENIVKKLSESANKNNIPADSKCLEDNAENKLLATAVKIPEVEVTVGNNCKKKKRKRNRKRKALPCIDTYALNDNNDEVFSNFTVEQSIASDSSCVRKHIRFTSPSPCRDTDEKKIAVKNHESENFSNEPSVGTGNVQNSECDKTENVSQVSVPDTQHIFKYSLSPCKNVPFKSNYCKDLFTKSFRFDETVRKSGTNDMAEIRQVVSVDAVQDNGVTGEINYSSLPSLNSMPPVGSKIAYKVLKLNEYYSPEVSNFKVGTIQHVDPHTDEMEIEFLKAEVTPGRTGKFENLQEDEIPPCEIKKMERISWSSVIEPKLIIG